MNISPYMYIDSEIIYPMEIIAGKKSKSKRPDFTDNMEFLLEVGMQSTGWENRIPENFLWHEYFRSWYYLRNGYTQL